MTETHTDDGGTGTTTGGPRVTPHQIRDVNRLRRSHTDRKIAGVAGGLGRHLDIDPTLVRVVLVVLVFFGGAGVLLYGALWLLVPEEGSDRGEIDVEPHTRRRLLLAALAVTFAVLVGNAWGDFWAPWPLAVIALVVMVLVLDRDSRGHRPRRAQDPGPAPYAGPDAPPAYASPGPLGTTTAAVPTTTGTAPDYSSASDPGGPGAPPPTRWTRPFVPPRRARSGPSLFLPTLAMIAIALGVLGLYDAHGTAVADGAYAALALTVVGVMALVAAWYGRGLGLGLLGLVAAVAMIASSVFGDGFHGTDATYRPQTSAGVHHSYDMGAGRLVIDLHDITDPAELDGRLVSIDGKVGEVRVLVPRDLDVDVHARVSGGGRIELDGRVADGWSSELTRSIDGGPTAPRLDLDIHLNFGQIDVVRSPA